MKKIIFIAVLIFSCLSVQAQDWCSWSFQYDFSLKSNKVSHYQFDSLEVLINEPFSSSKLQNSSINYNDSTSVYSVNLNYGCISCGYGDAEHPPTIFLRLFITDNFLNQKLSIIIPITFDTAKISFTMSLHQVSLGTIDFEDFLYSNSTGIRVKSNGKIYKYKKGEYLFPQPKKLIKVEKRVLK